MSATRVASGLFVRPLGCLAFLATAAFAAAPVTVTVTPAQNSLGPSASVKLSAAVTGAPNTAVTWSVAPAAGTVSAAGVYTAPASMNASQTVTVTATSVANAAAKATATVRITPTITVSPARVSVRPAQNTQCKATVTGLNNQAVVWSISPRLGSISPAGMYSPPAVTTPQTVTVTATSVADPTVSGSEIFIITPAAVVSVAPSSAKVRPGAGLRLSASVSGATSQAVTWAIVSGPGKISPAGLYSAPSSVASPQTVTIAATSIDSPSASATSSVQLQPGTVQTLATFNLTELFGVAWPDQPIEFRYDGGQPPANTLMIGPDGAEVPFQWISSCSDATAVNGCIVVRGNLPANANYTWTLESGAAPSATQTNPVALAVVGGNYELTNGLAGVRIVAAAANPAPFNLAPIQGILLPSGVWTGAGSTPDLLYNEGAKNAGCVGCALRSPMPNATAYSVSVVDAGPLKAVLKVSYSFNRPKYAYGSTVINSAGTGHYTLLVTLYANSKSVLIDEDADMQFSYYLPVYAQLNPTRARYRGHDSYNAAGYPDPGCGYETPVSITAATASSPVVITASAASLYNGQPISISGVAGVNAANGTFFAKTSGYPAGQFALYSDPNLVNPVAGSGAYSGGGTVKPAYRGWLASPVGDAFLDLNYSADVPAYYGCFNGPATYGYKKLMVNYPSAEHAAGWYEELYNAANPSPSAPVLGIYVGRFSRQVQSATGPSMPGIYSSNRHWISGAVDAGIQVDTLLRGPAGAITPLVHRNWGIFVGTQADLLPLGSHQPIADEQNMLTGINLSRIYTYQLTYPDPPGGWTWLYMSAAGASQLISQLQDGTSVCGSRNCFYTELKNSEGSVWGQNLLSMWQGNSSASVQTALNSVTALAQQLMTQLAAGDNRYGTLAYYNIGLQSSGSVALLNAILMNPNTTEAQKALAKAELALFGSILWDDDWWPIDNNSGESVGLANQIQQYLEYRTQYATADPAQPLLATKLNQAVTSSVNELDTFFSPTGAVAGSTHYQSAFFEPLITNYLALANTGRLSMADPRWSAYANWELSIQTPPEPRFGNVRKGYSNGDGNTEADVRTGLLGTAMNPVNASLAGNLLWAWRQSNSASLLTEDGQFMTTLASIDTSIPSVEPQLASTNIPGYHSVERHGFGAANETAVWFINGGFYSTGGHRHADDGQVSIYADSAPLAVDFNANLYYPETPGRFMHDAIVYDAELNHPWNADNPSLSDAATLMQNPTDTEFEAFANSTHAAGSFTAPDGTVWTRAVRTMAFDPAYPVIYVEDTFAGPGAMAGKTLTWNLMAAGPVVTPAGPVTPTTRFSPGCQSIAAQLPSAGPVYSLGQGLSQFTFTGASWPAHYAGGINWDLYTVMPDASGQFIIGNWGHGCQSSREMSEYLKTNGAAFAESQHILRVHATGGFATVLLPYPKTALPARSATSQPCGIRVVQGTETTCFSDSASTFTNGAESVLTVYDRTTQSAFGVTASGGPQEIVIQGNRIAWTLSGVAPNVATLTLPPGNWTPVPAIPGSGNTFTYAWPGGHQAQPVTIVFSKQ